MKILKGDTVKEVLRLKKYIKKYYALIIANMILSILAGAMSAAPVALIKRLFDKGLIGNNEKDIVYASSAMIGLAILGAIFIYWNNIFSGKISSTIYKNIIDDIYEKIQSLDMEYFSNAKIGDLMTRTTGDSSNVNKLILDVFVLFSYVFTAIFFLGIAIFTDWKLTIGMIIVAPVIVGLIKRYSKKLKRTGLQSQRASGELNSKLQESIAGIRVIKAFVTEEEEIEDFKRKSENLKKLSLTSVRYLAKSTAISEALNYIMVAILLLLGGYRVLRGSSFTTGDFVTIVGSISAMYSPVKRSMNKFNEINTNIPSIGRIFEILDIEPKIKNKKNPIKFDKFDENITFENVQFSYLDNTEKIIKGISFKVKKGETVALVGNSGGGKSTVVNLIPRFYDATDGSIKIDGIDIKDYELKSLRKNIGIVPQETFLFAGTILSNIKYGKQDATMDEIIEAAKKANAHNFIIDLEKGYDTEVGERGVKLSGGQKQRIAIARAILENPQILILDEATSALDNESEKLVQDALEKLMEGKTTFVIAHRLTTIEKSDKIIVLQKGKIEEEGNHEELIEKKGIYYSLYNKSFEGVE